ncbi:NADH-quinone oxidoreductase subunit C [Desulfallas thermosapovorans]|uniref:NADH-quinone oxidoreductase subunit C n=1 Tax=Desulfallas thermosapovorans DSM 6562 TaxID=1121431 RepID=A0A5S4ZQU3_9FIRM|nr:NADH-quinone oxidoreductase subunit C [Desulfallas thermosapovorans]TYO95177.1 NADH dehydrogenase subunit C [Desulfallas thermosapovorans DSM 6562]
MIDNAALVEELRQKFNYIEVNEQSTVIVPKDKLLEFMQALKDDYALDFLTNLTAVDYIDENKFEVIYNINSTAKGYTLMVKTSVDRDNPELPSVFPIWGGANWQEREVYDLLGIVFTGHPNLKRILLDYDYEGHPLRKDFQWKGGRE